MSYSKFIAELLVESGCYVHAPKNGGNFTVPTGDEILAYLSCRRLISKVTQREIIEEILIRTTKKCFPENITVTGIATAGIPWGHAIASGLKLPMLYARSKEKEYGLGGTIEGDINSSFKDTILVDDVLYTGSSVESAHQTLKENNIRVVGIICIASLNDKVADNFRQQGIKVIELTNYEDILTVAQNKEILDENEVKIMRKFYERR